MSAGSRSPLFNWLVRHWVCTYLIMGMAFVAFGATSLNLVQFFTANLQFLSMNGWEAVMEGGLLQLAELVLKTYLAVCFYVLFKTCEHALVQRLAHPDE